MDEKSILKYFGVPRDIISKVVQIKDKSDYYWAIEDDENQQTVTLQYAASRQDIYDYNDSTLVGKIVTHKSLIFRNSKNDNTLLVQKYFDKYNDDVVYIVNMFDDTKCLFQTE